MLSVFVAFVLVVGLMPNMSAWAEGGAQDVLDQVRDTPLQVQDVDVAGEGEMEALTDGVPLPAESAPAEVQDDADSAQDALLQPEEEVGFSVEGEAEPVPDGGHAEANLPDELTMLSDNGRTPGQVDDFAPTADSTLEDASKDGGAPLPGISSLDDDSRALVNEVLQPRGEETLTTQSASEWWVVWYMDTWTYDTNLTGQVALEGDTITITVYAGKYKRNGINPRISVDNYPSLYLGARTLQPGTFETWVYTVSGYPDKALRFIKSGVGNSGAVQFSSTTLPSKTFTLDANGGSGGGSHTDTMNKAIQIASLGMAPTREGYAFSGWNTASDGSGTHYNADTGLVVLSSDITLYAEWTRTARLVTGPVGSASPSSAIFYYDADGTAYYNGVANASATISLSPGDGWTAIGWTKNPTSTTVSYDPGFSVAGADLTSANDAYYAIGKRNLSVAYDGNGADAGTAPATQGGGEQVYSASGSAPLATDTFTIAGNTGGLAKDGCVFAGWNTAADGSGAAYEAGATASISEPTVLHAQWARTVTYDANGGKAATAPASQLKYSGRDLMLSVDRPSRDADTADIITSLNYNDGATADSQLKTKRSEGWTFSGWNTEADGSGTAYQPGDTYTADEPLTLYAQWQVQNPIYASTALPTPTRDGYDFLGWATVQDTSGLTEGTDYDLYAGGSTYTPTADGTLYAQWQLKTYEITYDANGSGVSDMPSPATTTKTHGTDLTLADAPTRADDDESITLTLNYKGGSYLSGDDANAFGATHDSATATATTSYAFKEWNTNSGGTGTAYAAGGAYSTDGDATLYAIWDANTTGYQTYTLPDASRTSATSVTYTFIGWSADPTAKQGDSGILSAGSTYAPTASTTLYAVWDPPTYAIEYDGNADGDTVTGDLGMQNKEADVDVTLHAGPTRTPASSSFTVSYDANGGTVSTTSDTAANSTTYTFDAWNTEADGSGTSYNGGASYSANFDLKLYAQWTQGGSVASVTLPTPTRTGYSFQGWYTAATGGTKAGDAGASYTPDGDVTLFAQWKADEYPVAYDGNGTGVTGVPAAQTKVHDVDLALSSDEPSRANEDGTVSITYDTHGGDACAAASSEYGSTYTFLRWTAGSASYAPGSTYAQNSAVTLKAEWGEVSTYTTVKLPATQREGYTFLGWYDAESGGNKVGDAGDDYTPSSKDNVTLHAQWEVITYDVTYDGNTDDATLTGVPGTQVKEHGTALALSSAKPTRDDTANEQFTVTFDRRGGMGLPDSTTSTATTKHTFVKWNTAADGSGTDYEAGASYTENAALQLYAQWEDAAEGAEVELPAAPTPPDASYTFKGWSLSKDTDPDDATGALLAPGTKVNPTEDTAYYAIYDPPTYIVSYDANGGANAPDAQNKKKGTDLALSSDTPTRDDATVSYDIAYDAAGGSASRASDEIATTTSYEFVGWAEDATAGSAKGIVTDAEWAAYSAAKKHVAGSAYTTDADLDLFAQWKESTAHDPATVTLPTADRPGYTFLGWYTQSEGGDRIGGAGDTYTPEGRETTLYAQWEPYTYPSGGGTFTYTVVFENPEDTQVATQQFTFGRSQALGAGMLVAPEGKTFAGWQLKGGSTTFTEHQLVSNLTSEAGGTVRLVALWTELDAPVAYEVKYYEQEVDGSYQLGDFVLESDDEMKAEDGDVVSVPVSALTAPLGFHLDESLTVESGTVDASGDKLVLEVYWARNVFDVEFDKGASDATGQMDDQYFVWNSGERLDANGFKRSGYKFVGWKVTERDGAVLTGQSVGGLATQALDWLYTQAVEAGLLSVQAVGDSVADQSDGSRLTWTDGGHVTLTAQWERDSSGGSDNKPGGEDEKPDGGDDKPGGSDQPSGDDKPSGGSKPSGGDQPSGDDKPSGGSKPSGGDDKPDSGDDDANKGDSNQGGSNGNKGSGKDSDANSGAGSDADSGADDDGSGSGKDGRVPQTGDQLPLVPMGLALFALALFLVARPRLASK